MSFRHPLMLVLLVLPVVLAYWEWTRLGFRLVLPFDHSGQPSGLWLRRVVNAANLLPAVLLALALVLLAVPQRSGPPERARELTNLLLLLDVSGSMTTPFGDGTRFDSAMAAINEFSAHRPGDAFGLTIFGNEVLHWLPLTKDVNAIRLATPFLRPEKQPPWMGGTQIGKALHACRTLLAAQARGDRVIILVSDGDSADLGGSVALDVAQALKEERITVYAIIAQENAPPSEIDVIASHTGGAVFSAGNPAALNAVFHHIDAMQKTKFKQSAPAVVDDFRPFAMAGLGVAGLHVLALFGMRYMPW